MGSAVKLISRLSSLTCTTTRMVGESPERLVVVVGVGVMGSRSFLPYFYHTRCCCCCDSRDPKSLSPKTGSRSHNTNLSFCLPHGVPTNTTHHNAPYTLPHPSTIMFDDDAQLLSHPSLSPSRRTRRSRSHESIPFPTGRRSPVSVNEEIDVTLNNG